MNARHSAVAFLPAPLPRFRRFQAAAAPVAGLAVTSVAVRRAAFAAASSAAFWRRGSYSGDVSALGRLGPRAAAAVQRHAVLAWSIDDCGPRPASSSGRSRSRPLRRRADQLVDQQGFGLGIDGSGVFIDPGGIERQRLRRRSLRRPAPVSSSAGTLSSSTGTSSELDRAVSSGSGNVWSSSGNICGLQK